MKSLSVEYRRCTQNYW